VGLIDIELEEESLDFALNIFGSLSLEVKRRLSFPLTCCTSSREDCPLILIFESLPAERVVSGVIVALPPDAVETDTLDEGTPTRTPPPPGADTKAGTGGAFRALPMLDVDATAFCGPSTLP
jgi:hypothetical protein